MLKIHSLETFGTHEGPGIRLVLFLQGCNMACAYCHNPDTKSLQGGYNISLDKVMDILEENKPYFANNGGLTVSGGEPGLQADELLKLFQRCRAKKIHTALDTNATLTTTVYKKVLAEADLAIIDLKEFDSKAHEKLTGLGNEVVLSNIAYREKTKKPFWVRFVLVPNLTDNLVRIEAMAKYLSQFRYLERLEILPYHNLGVYKYDELKMPYKLASTPLPPPALIKAVKEIFQQYLSNVFIRN